MSADVGLKPPAPEPAYLGDGLYADFDGYQIELYASNGVRKTNQVYLDSSTLQAFLNYVDQIRKA